MRVIGHISRYHFAFYMGIEAFERYGSFMKIDQYEKPCKMSYHTSLYMKVDIFHIRGRRVPNAPFFNGVGRKLKINFRT